MLFTASLVEPVSRRTANMPYVLFMICFVCFHLALEIGYLIALQLTFQCDAFVKPQQEAPKTKKEGEEKSLKTPPLQPYCQFMATYQSSTYKVFNKSGLVLFLVANLLTGAINFSLDTTVQGPEVAVAILIGYSLVVMMVGHAIDAAAFKWKAKKEASSSSTKVPVAVSEDKKSSWSILWKNEVVEFSVFCISLFNLKTFCSYLHFKIEKKNGSVQILVLLVCKYFVFKGFQLQKFHRTVGEDSLLR